jgi:hypothetical protein
MIVVVYEPLSDDPDSGPILTSAEGTPDRLTYLGDSVVEVFEKRTDWAASYEVKARKVVPRYPAKVVETLMPFAIKAVRAERDAKIRDEVDSINPMRWATMSPDLQAQWGAYRQALLDMTEPSSLPDPFNPVWPTRPPYKDDAL